LTPTSKGRAPAAVGWGTDGWHHAVPLERCPSPRGEDAMDSLLRGTGARPTAAIGSPATAATSIGLTVAGPS
jgi:hypothetical protein